jgi:hypothetical protein
MERAAFAEAAKAHEHFSTDCFNRCWTLIDKPSRSEAETLEMLALAQASFWHWSQRPDHAGKRLSVGYWQLSRVHALAGEGTLAKRYAERCLGASEGLKPFYLAYAHEALARAAAVAGDVAGRDRHAAEARRLCAEVADPAERDLVLQDLERLA